MDSKGDLILTGSFRGGNQLELWSLQQRSLMATIDWDDNKKTYDSAYVCSAMFDKKMGETIIGGTTGRNEVKMVEHYGDTTNTVARITNLPKACFSVDINMSGNMLAFGCGDGKLRLLEIGDSKASSSYSLLSVKQ